MSVNWIRDEAGIAVLADLGIHVSDVVISVDSINWKASAENRARKNPLDESRVEAIASAYDRGIPMPMIFIRKDARRGNVIATGNHRGNAVRGKAKDIRVHLFACTDGEFEIACKLLNTTVGEGLSKEDRINAAIDASERLGVEKKKACEMYGISQSCMAEAVKTKEMELKIASLPAGVRECVTVTHARNLGDLAKNANVWRAATQAVATSKMPAKDILDLAREARSESTEAGQVSVFERYVKFAEVDAEKVVPRRKRKAFLQACTQLSNMKGKTTWESLEFTTAEIKDAKAMATSVANYLSSLCKANG